MVDVCLWLLLLNCFDFWYGCLYFGILVSEVRGVFEFVFGVNVFFCQEGSYSSFVKGVGCVDVVLVEVRFVIFVWWGVC